MRRLRTWGPGLLLVSPSIILVGIFVYGCNTSSSSKWKKLYGTAGITMPITMGRC